MCVCEERDINVLAETERRFRKCEKKVLKVILVKILKGRER